MGSAFDDTTTSIVGGFIVRQQCALAGRKRHVRACAGEDVKHIRARNSKGLELNSGRRGSICLPVNQGFLRRACQHGEIRLIQTQSGTFLFQALPDSHKNFPKNS